MSVLADLFKKHLLFLILIPIIVFSQLILLEPHLKYGFGDVDWGFLNFYNKAKILYPNIVDNFIYTFKTWGVYAHQSYYIGFIYDLFGLDFEKFQIVTNSIKTLATIAAYPFFYIISKNKRAASIGTLLFAFSYSAVGAMYTTVASSDYLAVLTCLIFLWMYFYILKVNEKRWGFMLLLFLLLHTTLFLSTERMNPIIFLLFFIEGYIFIKKKQVQTFRWLVLFLPTVFLVVIYPDKILDFFGSNGIIVIKKILDRDYYLILNPFISLGSTIVPTSYWKYFGVVDTSGLIKYTGDFLRYPFSVFMIFSISVGLVIYKKKLEFIQQMLLSVILLGLVFYLAVANQHLFDGDFLKGAFIGGYVLIFGALSYFQFLKDKQNKQLIGIFLGIFSAFIFIITTWLGADSTRLIFRDAHRYLTMPSLFICLSLGCLLSLIMEKLFKLKGEFKFLAVIPILVVVIIIWVWSLQTYAFFNDGIKEGFGAKDKTNMRSQLLEQTKDLSSSKPSIFYFDFSEDHDRGYYYDNALLGGFSTWMMWHPNINFNESLKPSAFWNNYELLKSSYINDPPGFKVNGRLYPLENFYAFKLKERQVINIKNKILQTVVLSP